MLRTPLVPGPRDLLSFDPSDLRLVLAHAVPVILLLAAGIAGRRSVALANAWRIAQVAAAATLAVAGIALLWGLVWPLPGTLPVPGAMPGAAQGWSTQAWSTAGSVVLLLVTFLGWVITRYAATYLHGEPRQRTFVRWLLATLAGSSLVLVTDNLGVLSFAWIGTSLALQNLLTFYADRPQAQMAAHKKFLVSRLADVCTITAVGLLFASFGTLQIGELARKVAAGAELGGTAQFAVLLIAVAVLLKSAQLPFHGWLIQVMEAPTPVSALLHAGVVNLGGFVLIRLAPLVASAPAAQVLLVVAGSLTAVLAALVMSTRISIKVALAWSTCAQMGFMVMQCGLGLFEMALLHLVAHSLYKAHAFLAAGGTVQQNLVSRMTPAITPPPIAARLGAALVAASIVLTVSWAFGIRMVHQPALVAMALVVSLALTPLLAGRIAGVASRWLVRGFVTSLAVAVAYFGLHHLLHGWLIHGALDANPALQSLPLAAWVGACFGLLFLLQAMLALRPNGPIARALHVRCYGGLFLDEWFTRLTLRVWPIQRPLRRINPILSGREEAPQ